MKQEHLIPLNSYAHCWCPTFVIHVSRVLVMRRLSICNVSTFVNDCLRMQLQFHAIQIFFFLIITGHCSCLLSSYKVALNYSVLPIQVDDELAFYYTMSLSELAQYVTKVSYRERKQPIVECITKKGSHRKSELYLDGNRTLRVR